MLVSIPLIVWAQEEKVKISVGRITIDEIFRQIEEQTIYTIAFNHEELNVKEVRSIEFEIISLSDLLALILKDTECRYKIVGKHIIITPVLNQAEKKQKNQLSETGIGQFSVLEYMGRVLEGAGKTPLEYATITLLGDDNQPLISGASNSKGMFRLISPQKAQQIRVSFIGYKTQSKETVQAGDIGVFVLEQDEKVLDEVKVSASGVLYTVDRNTYIVTPQMIEGVSNGQELLNKIHGVRFDRVSNTVKVGNETNVLLLVDGMQQSQEYIKNLLPERINKIEVVNEPSGRFLSEGYSAIINFILKKDYTGYDIYVRNFSIVNPGGTNGDDWLMNEQPGGGFTYTRKKINIYGSFVHGRSRWNTAIEKGASYNQGRYLVSEPVSTADPNEKYKYRGDYIGGGLNYQIAPEHILSLQGDYTYSNVSTKDLFRMKDISGGSNVLYKVDKNTFNKTKDDDFVGTVFYKGKMDRVSLYSDFSYNYYSNKVNNEFVQTGSQNYNQKNAYDENKKQAVFNLEGDYKLTDKSSVSVGYSTVWKKYDSNGDFGMELLNYKEKRHTFFGYISLSPSEKIRIKTGLGVELISVNTKEEEKNYTSVQPYLQVNYAVNKNLNVNLSYVANNTYPSLFQLSELKSFIDSCMVQIGNPYLKPALTHTMSGRFTLWNRLSVVSVFKFTPKEISEVFIKEDVIINSTFENVEMKKYNARIIYDQPVGRYFSLKSSVLFYFNKVKHSQISNSVKGWLLDSEINYYNPDYNWGAQLAYYRGLEKNLLLQGYQMVNMDGWLLSINKQFWNKKLSVHLSYIPPITWGVRKDQKKDVETPFYKEVSNLNLNTYDNMLLLRLILRFDSGKVKRTDKESNIEREVRGKRTVGF